MLDFKWKIKGLSEEESWRMFLEATKSEATRNSHLSTESKIHIQEQWRHWCAAQSGWSWGFFTAFIILTSALILAFLEKSSGIYAWVTLLYINLMLWVGHQKESASYRDQVASKLYWLPVDSRERLAAMEEGPKKALEVLVSYEVHRQLMGWQTPTVEADPDWVELLTKTKETKTKETKTKETKN